MSAPGADMSSPPPSINAAGGAYNWLEGLALGEIQAATVPLSLLKAINSYIGAGDKSGSKQQEATNGDNGDKMFESGRRDNDLFHTANCLVKGGMPGGEMIANT